MCFNGLSKTGVGVRVGRGKKVGNQEKYLLVSGTNKNLVFNLVN